MTKSRAILSDTALLVIDMQIDLLDPSGPAAKWGFFDFAKKYNTINNMKKALYVSRKHCAYVIYVNLVYRPDDFREKSYLLMGTDGIRIIPELAPEAGDIVLEKRRWGAFFSTELEILLRTYGIKRVAIIGQSAHACCMATALEAKERDYEVIMLEDCFNAPSEELMDASRRIWEAWDLKVVQVSGFESYIRE